MQKQVAFVACFFKRIFVKKVKSCNSVLQSGAKRCIIYLRSEGGVGRMKVYTVEDVADLLKLKPETIRVMLRDKELNGFKAGKAWRVTEEDLKKYIQKQGGMIE